MQRAMSGRVLACSILVLCCGCAPVQHFPRFSVLSNQSVDLEKVDLDALAGEPTTGSATTFSVLGVLPLGRPRIETAVERALMQHDADLLTNAVVRRQKSWAILLGWETITVEGTAVKTLADRPGENRG